jgi:hypothetical protein
MNRKQLAMVLLMAVAFAFLPNFAIAAPAAPAAQAGPATASKPEEEASLGIQTENLFTYPNDLTIHGVTNRQDFYFEMTPSRILTTGSYLELVFSHSPTFLPKKSTLTILLDDEPLGSVFLNESNVKRTSWQADLSDKQLEPGFHKLSVISYMVASENPCDDQSNPANWLILHKESLVHLRLKQAYDQADFTYYPSPFLEKGGLKPLQTLFVVPDTANEAQLKALGELAGFFSAQVPANMLSFQAFKESDVVGEWRKENMIWIGSESQWGELGKQLKVRGAADGKIKLSVSPWNPKSTILSVNGSNQEIIASIRHLITPELYGQLSGQIFDISKLASQGRVPQGSTNGGTELTLEDLGFGDLVVDSPIIGTARITHTLPPEIDISKPGRFKMHFKHAKTLNFAQSVVTVKVNGVPVKSRYLNEESSDFGALDLEISPEQMSNRNLIVDVSFQFSSAQGACTANSQIGNWAVISKQSLFSFKSRPNGSMQLEELPYPFVVRQQWTATAFVLPVSPSSEEISLFVTTCAMIGKSAAFGSEDGDTFLVRFNDDRLPSEAAGKNLVYIGAADKVPKAIAASSSYPVKIRDGGFVPANDSIPLLPNAGNGILMAMVPSPYTENKQVFVLAATDQAALKKANEQLSDPGLRAKIIGKSAFIDDLDRVHTIQTAIAAVDEPSLSEQAANLLNINNNPVWTKFIFIAAFVLVLGLIGILLWLTRKRSR